MASDSNPSFSVGRKWSIGFDVILRSAVVLAVVVMLNYLSGHYFERRYLSAHTRVELSPRTVNFIRSITNEVKVTLYYDQEDDLYSTVAAVLNEYKSVNPRISVRTVDPTRDAAEAIKTKAAYKLPESMDKREKNLVIFDCDGRVKYVNGVALAEYTLEEVPNETQIEYRRKVVAFKGEMMFTSLLLAVTHPKPLIAYFLEGHGEHRINDGDEVTGYLKFASELAKNFIAPKPLSLLGTNTIPEDCNLLVVAGATTGIPEEELEKIQQYLIEGGRLLALINPLTRREPSGIERILARWNVIVGDSEVRDPENTSKGADLFVFGFTRHPVVNPLLGSALHMILPRPIAAMETRTADTDAPKVSEIAFAGPKATVADRLAKEGKRYGLIAAIEKGAAPGVVTTRGTTRIVVAGDSTFLGNQMIESGANRDFAGYAANWLLDRTQLLAGLGPRPVDEFRLNLTQTRQRQLNWILLAAMPGGILAFGGLVWLRRRK